MAIGDLIEKIDRVIVQILLAHDVLFHFDSTSYTVGELTALSSDSDY